MNKLYFLLLFSCRGLSGSLGNGVLLLVFEHGAKIGVYFHRCIHICPFVYGHDVQSFTLKGW